MKRFLPILCAFLSAGLAFGQSMPETPSSPSTPQTPEVPGKPEKVQTEDGRSFFGIVTIKDDYTISIRTDSGLTNLPMASLQGDSWKKYSKDDQREKDGKFWSERQDALTKKWEKGGKKGPLEDALAEVAPHLSEIVTFKETKAATEAKKPGDPKAAPSPASVSTIEIKLFSAPGGFGGGAPEIPGMPGFLPSAPSAPSMPSIPSLP